MVARRDRAWPPRVRPAAAACAGALLLAGCQPATGGFACTEDFRYGLTVTVIDSATGAPPASAVFIARSGTFVDSAGPRAPAPVSLAGPPLLLFASAGERPGSYDLTVRAPGYADWSRTGVIVTADACHVILTEVTARLQR